MKDIEIGPIRPPSESNSLLIRVTRGCHWNKCYFCGLYKSMQFSMRPIDETIEDIRQQAQFYQGKKINSCFLQDGDALVLKTDYLLRILDAINQYFPDIQYITSYAMILSEFILLGIGGKELSEEMRSRRQKH